jgi:hypothetical protein
MKQRGRWRQHLFQGVKALIRKGKQTGQNFRSQSEQKYKAAFGLSDRRPRGFYSLRRMGARPVWAFAFSEYTFHSKNFGEFSEL